MIDTHFDAFIRRFSDNGINNVLKSGRNLFLSSEGLDIARHSITKDIFSAGIFLGELKDRFYPSPACIDMISKLSDADKRKIFVNKKAEWLFLCGRNILLESVVKNPHNLSEGLVMVQNEKDENLGYGVFNQQGKDLVIKNLLDKGKYLRMNEKGRR